MDIGQLRRDKLAVRFAQDDVDGDGFLEQSDYDALGRLLSDRLGAGPEIRERIAAGFAEQWRLLCAHADIDADGQISHPAALEHHHAEPDPNGTPLVASGRTADLRLRITDPHTHQPLPDRHIGEIWVSGASVGDGYHHQPDATANTFHHAADGTWLRTGDLGFLHNQELYVTGRLKETIIINGRNLYPHDLEDAAHRATAIGQQFQIPIGIVLVPAGTIRRTTSGKIRRHHMRTLFQKGEIHAIHQELTPAIGTPA